MKKFLALLMAGVMLMSFAACGGNNEEETTKEPEITTEAPVNSEVEDATEEVIEDEVTEAEEETEEVTVEEDVTDKDDEAVTEKKEETEKTTKKPETQKPADTAKDPSKWSKAEIIEYASKALDRVKSEKAGYTKNGHMVVKGDVKGLPSWLVSIFTKDETTTMAKGSDNKNDFPASGYDWSCKLRPQDVESATIKVSGTTYEVMIKLGTEKNPATGTASSYGRAVSVIDASDAAGMVPGLKSVDMIYHDGYIHAKIDSKTGNITYAQIAAAADAKANIALLGDVEAKDITSTETYTNFVW